MVNLWSARLKRLAIPFFLKKKLTIMQHPLVVKQILPGFYACDERLEKIDFPYSLLANKKLTCM
jgi:hypothetical protein